MAYRTPLSVNNEKIWYFAQKLYGKRLILGAFMMTPIIMIGFQISLDFWTFLLFLVFEIIIAMVMAISVGRTLAQKFY
ncbi:SdpI family protein [Bacillus sp. JJ1521]|uniref:SdpI family protein n=1 Tax=Bacillus sp. JJ1521 TaxID=3122957 RepID=UPI002FFFA4F9